MAGGGPERTCISTGQDITDSVDLGFAVAAVPRQLHRFGRDLMGVPPSSPGRRLPWSTELERQGARVCYRVAMRLHITLDEATVAELDRRVGRRGRSAYIVQLLQRAFEDERRWEDIEAALGSIPDSGHDWDDDPAAWVRSQRASDPARSG